MGEASNGRAARRACWQGTRPGQALLLLGALHGALARGSVVAHSSDLDKVKEPWRWAGSRVRGASRLDRLVAPEIFKSGRCQFGVADGVLD